MRLLIYFLDLFITLAIAVLAKEAYGTIVGGLVFLLALLFITSLVSISLSMHSLNDTLINLLRKSKED